MCTDNHFQGNSNLSEQCPICAHAPLSPAKPLKSLRLTIIAFVKNIEKKREKERLSAMGAEILATPITPVAPPTPTVAPTPAVEKKPDQNVNNDLGATGIEPSNGATIAQEEASVVESVEQPSAEQDVGSPFAPPSTSINTM
jgi:hypothetical protein